MKRVLLISALIIGIVLGAWWESTLPTHAPTVPTAPTSTTPVASSTDWENGMKIVTQADSNSTIHLSKNERFVIQLGDALSWNTSITPDGIITRVPNSTTANGVQGVYEASQAGTATLRATGRPICKPNQPCPMFILEVTITLEVSS